MDADPLPGSALGEDFAQSTIECCQAVALRVSRMLAPSSEAIMDVSDENFLRVRRPCRHRLQRGRRERTPPDPRRSAQNGLSILHQSLFRRLRHGWPNFRIPSELVRYSYRGCQRGDNSLRRRLKIC